MYSDFKTIAAISTPMGQGGIAGIRISGERAISIAKIVFKPRYNKDLTKMKGYTAAYGELLDSSSNLVYDNGVCIVYREPKSYTGENVVEIFCHGGVYVAEKTLDLLIKAGATPAAAGEFTKRAYLNGKIDLSQAEAIMDTITAKNDTALKMAMSARGGKLSKEIEEVTEKLLDLSAFFGAWFDYPEEGEEERNEKDIEVILKSSLDTLKNLVSSYDQGRLVKEGVPTVIVGRPNVGKSTIMNLLAKEQRSIVTEIPGTTRDVIEESVRVGNIVLRLSDTAGIRHTDDIVEQIGVEIAYKKIEEANLVLVVVEPEDEIDNFDRKFLDILKKKNVLVVVNKIDTLEDEGIIKKHSENFKNIVYISAKNKIGIEDFKEKILKMLSLLDFDPMGSVLSNKRQLECVLRAIEYLEEALETLISQNPWDMVSISLESAISELLELTGKSAGEEIVNNIFEQFCVGK